SQLAPLRQHISNSVPRVLGAAPQYFRGVTSQFVAWRDNPCPDPLGRTGTCLNPERDTLTLTERLMFPVRDGRQLDLARSARWHSVFEPTSGGSSAAVGRGDLGPRTTLRDLIGGSTLRVIAGLKPGGGETSCRDRSGRNLGPHAPADTVGDH